MTRRTLAFAPPAVDVDPPAPARPTSPYLDSHEALDYLRLKSLSALYFLMKERGLPYVRCGGRLRFDTRELDAWLRGTTALELRTKKAR